MSLRNVPGPIWAPSPLLFVTIALVLWLLVPRLALAAPTLEGSIGELQPRLTEKARTTWARAIRAADADAGLGHPKLIAAMIFRESSYLHSIATGERRGALGEIGPLQIMPFSPAWRLRPQHCDITDPRCNLRAGVRWLVAVRDEHCPGDAYRWVAGYGMRRCPAPGERHHSALRARELHCRIDRDCERLWEPELHELLSAIHRRPSL